MSRKAQTLRRDRQTLAVAGKQRHAQVLLQRAHLVAHRAVGDMGFIGGARKVLMPGGCLKGAQGHKIG
jgi:hypothetical protein